MWGTKYMDYAGGTQGLNDLLRLNNSSPALRAQPVVSWYGSGDVVTIANGRFRLIAVWLEIT